RLIVITALLWAGMILGISFLESWIKFRAPTLTKAIGLDVGRTVFKSFHQVQCILLIVIILITFFAKLTLINWLIVGILTIIFILQLAWLFPTLNNRVNVILAGGKLKNSHAHKVYGILEIAKFFVLLDFSMRLML
ncbi:MAG TPA: hypothetical protein VHA52_12655, partial [Candidatus Babeliaceae bacterium]|nr:hypothetical protein [Candidatus Babeliaceae bacterium]